MPIMPFFLGLLEKLIDALLHICQSSYETKLFASAFSLAFFGLLRVEEFTSEGYHVINFMTFQYKIMAWKMNYI